MHNAQVAIIIETPKESRLKFKLDAATGSYKVDRVLPKGLRFPFNFGFVPNTRAEDGDPTDVLLILDEILFPGCCLDCHLLGVLRAEQTEKGAAYRNDRIVAVPAKDADAPRALNELERNFTAHVERFFADYHQAEGNSFRVLGLGDSNEAHALITKTTIR